MLLSDPTSGANSGNQVPDVVPLGDEDHDLNANTQHKTLGRYGASCTGCRRRKQRCDGKVPECARCRRLKEECVYERNARSSICPQSVPLLLQTFQFLHTLTDPTAGPPDFALRPLIKKYLADTPLPVFARTGAEVSSLMQNHNCFGDMHPVAKEHRAGEGVDITSGSFQTRTKNKNTSWNQNTSEVEELLMHTSLTDDGQNRHFGVASLFWESPPDAIVEHLRHHSHQSRRSSGFPGQGTPLVDQFNIQQMKELNAGLDEEDPSPDQTQECTALKTDLTTRQRWESLAYSRVELERGPEAANDIQHLVETYFCWQDAPHCFVYRPVFMRDMALGGKNFNEFLLQVILLCAIRYSSSYIKRSGGEAQSMTTLETGYLTRAKALLLTEMDKPPSIPTVQGFLLLGQRECSHGNLSQGWMYTGMAFRAMRDMGIHLDCNRLPTFGFGTLTVEDREIRCRLFWSAFTWDKVISLALGRTPTFNAYQSVSPDLIVDDNEDTGLWQPTPAPVQGPDLHTYSPQESYSATNFKHFIKLCKIIQTIIMQLYVGRPRHLGIGRFMRAIGSRLNEWFAELPAEVKLDTANLPEHCPPPHIVATNALYHASWILLYRIFIPNTLPAPIGAPEHLLQEASAKCTAGANEMHGLLQLYTKSFGPHNMPYGMIWSVYSAATINSIDFQSSNQRIAATAADRLSMSMYALEFGQSQAPGIKRSIEILKNRLRRKRSNWGVATVFDESLGALPCKDLGQNTSCESAAIRDYWAFPLAGSSESSNSSLSHVADSTLPSVAAESRDRQPLGVLDQASTLGLAPSTIVTSTSYMDFSHPNGAQNFESLELGIFPEHEMGEHQWSDPSSSSFYQQDVSAPRSLTAGVVYDDWDALYSQLMTDGTTDQICHYTTSFDLGQMAGQQGALMPSYTDPANIGQPGTHSMVG